MIRVETQPQTPRTDRPRRPPVTLARAVLLMCAVGVASTLTTPMSRAEPTGVLKDVGFDQNLNAQIPLSLPFRDQDGKDVLLANYFGKRPVILIMGYRDCPMMCSQVLSELTRSLKPLTAEVGKDFDIVNGEHQPEGNSGGGGQPAADLFQVVSPPRFDRGVAWPGGKPAVDRRLGQGDRLSVQVQREDGFLYPHGRLRRPDSHRQDLALLFRGGISRSGTENRDRVGGPPAGSHRRSNGS